MSTHQSTDLLKYNTHLSSKIVTLKIRLPNVFKDCISVPLSLHQN